MSNKKNVVPMIRPTKKETSSKKVAEEKTGNKTFAVDFSAQFNEVCANSLRVIISAPDADSAVKKFIELSNQEKKILCLSLPPTDEQWQQFNKGVDKDKLPKKPVATPTLVDLKSAILLSISSVAVAKMKEN